MKRTTLLLFALVSIFFSLLTAAPIERATALQYAKQFLNQTSVPQYAPGRVSTAVLESEPTYVSEDASTGTAHFYVYNLSNNGGFVIVAADTRVRTIIGFSFNGSFDINKIPENMKWWLGYYEKQIQYAIDYLQESISPEEYFGTLTTANIIVEPLLGAMAWGQRSPYNNQAPLIGGQRAVTGCVATAMAQIMRYHHHPAQGVGSHSYTTRTHKLPLSVTFEGTQYDWGNMTDTYSPQSTPVQNSAVAQLMYHAGVAVDMDYTVNGSGAYSGDVPMALVNYFNYDIGIDAANRVFYTQEDWHNMIKNELNAARPVYYSGVTSNDEGHAFICDGYRSDDFFHINWGWSGYSNGYFSLELLNSLQGSFSYNQYVVTHIQNPQPNSVEVEQKMGLGGGTSTSTDSVGRYEAIKVKLINYRNASPRVIEGLKLGFGLYQENVLIDVVGQVNLGNPIKPNRGLSVEISFSLPFSILPGKYIMKPLFALEDNVWKAPLVNPNMTNELEVEITAQSVFVGKRNYSIHVSSNLPEGGTVTGSGKFADGTSHTVIATANTGFSFTNWTENGTEVSTEPNYTFNVDKHRALVANFVLINTNFRSKADGNWEEPATWQFSSDNVTWVDATIAPTATNATSVTVEHVVTVNISLSEINNLTIKSGATLVGDISGQATVKQIAENHRTYYMGAPVSGATETGVGAAIEFTESNNIWSTTTTPFATAGKGYGVQVGKNLTGTTELSFTGTLNNGPLTMTLTSSNRRFNFLANPYPSYITSANVVADAHNVEKTLWFYSKEDNYNFTTYNVEADVSIPEKFAKYSVIPPLQGFWVRVNSATAPNNATLTFSNEMRTHKPEGSTAAFRAPQASEKQLLRLQVTNGTITDETAILFSEKADQTWNSSKMTNPSLSIYTLKDGENLALNSNTAIEYDVEIPVGLKAESGLYTFSASKFDNFGTEIVFLLDKVSGVSTELSSGNSHTVNFSEAYDGTDRFALVFPRSGVTTGLEGAEVAGFFAFANNNRITVSSDAQSGTIHVYNNVGQQVAAEAINGKLTTVSTALQEGVYIVKLNNQTTKVVVK